MSYKFILPYNLNILGLVPPIANDFKSESYKSEIDYQISASIERFREISKPIDKYDWLMSLLDHNKRLFFFLVKHNLDEIVPFIYTPTVGAACEQLSKLYRPGRGLFITIEQKGKILQVLENWPSKSVKAICVTDGERILGLGDLGANGMGIPVGKLALYTALAGIPPSYLLPITLDVGTNNEYNLKDPLYMGLKKKRVSGTEYDEFMEEFMVACKKRYGQNILIQFEDFGNHNAFRLLEKYENQYSTFNDDIQGTAAVVLASLLASSKITKRKLSEERIVCYGAGEASLGFVELVILALEKRFGISKSDSLKNISLIDSKGLIVNGRSSGGLTSTKLLFAKPKGTKEMTDLVEIINEYKPTALIGASAVPNSFTKAALEAMYKINGETSPAVIMALSNPTSKSECTAQEAYDATKGHCVFTTGSPFDEVQTPLGAKAPSQANNAFIFPGISLGIITGNIFPVTKSDFLVSAETLAEMADENQLKKGSVLPRLSDSHKVATKIATRVIEEAIKEKRTRTEFKDPINEQIQLELMKNSSYPDMLDQSEINP